MKSFKEKVTQQLINEGYIKIANTEEESFIDKVNTLARKTGFGEVKDMQRAKKVLKKLKLTKEDLENKIKNAYKKIQELEKELDFLAFPGTVINVGQNQLIKQTKEEIQQQKEYIEDYNEKIKYFYGQDIKD